MHLTEIILILLVALLVIKPEHLPGLAFKIGSFVKWIKNAVNKIKTEIETPLKSDSSQHE